MGHFSFIISRDFVACGPQDRQSRGVEVYWFFVLVEVAITA